MPQILKRAGHRAHRRSCAPGSAAGGQAGVGLRARRELDLDRLRLPRRSSVICTGRPCACRRCASVSASLSATSLPSTATMMSPPRLIASPAICAGMSPALMPALSAGLPWATETTSAPLSTGRFRPLSESSTGRVVMPEVAGLDAALLEVRQQLARDVDRYREADPDVAVARAAGRDLRVDADHLAGRVDQRAAGVAGVDRGVGLDHVA